MIKILDWTTKEPLNMIGYCAGVCWGSPLDDKEKNIKRAKNCISSGHGRVGEYPDVYCVIEGYSARVIRELYTHIIGTTRLQSSTRYVDARNMDPQEEFYYPPTLNKAQQGILEEGYKDIIFTYKHLEEEGVSKENAANILPLGMDTKIVFKINLRALIHMFNERTCARAYIEFRALCIEFREQLKILSPEWEWICDNLLVPKCKMLGYCTEEHSCGKEISKKDALEAIKEWKEKNNG